jgi:glycosyltransferase involved in cell wall biosynthesis
MECRIVRSYAQLLPLAATDMSQRPLHILCLPSWYPTREQPVFGNFIERHVRAIAAEHRVTLIYPMVGPRTEGEPEVMAVTDRNVQQVFVYLENFGFRQRMKGLKKALAFIRLSPTDFDLVHCHVSLPAGLWALWFKMRFGLPLVLTEHWTVYHPERWGELPWFKRLLIRFLLRKTDVLCPVSGQLGHAISAHIKMRETYVVPNVVDTRRFFRGPKAKPDNEFRFLHVSSLLDEQKNISGLLNAFARVAAHHPLAKLAIGGDGDLAAVRKMAEERGISPGQINFLSEMNEQQVAARMRESDAFVLFSNYENLPCVILEAFCCGLPVISTDVGGISEHLDSLRGILIPKGDEEALVRAMTDCIEGRKYFDSGEIARYGARHFSFEEIGRQYSRVYRRLLEK